MADIKPKPMPMLVTGVLVLSTVATVALIANFSEVGVASTWPAVAMAMGVGLLSFGYWELGVGLFGFFTVWLLGNLAVLPEFSKSWPICLIWIAVMVVIGFLRARAKGRKGAA